MWVQQDAYKEDYDQLKAGEALPKTSRLLDLYYDRSDPVMTFLKRQNLATWTYRSCKDDTRCPQTDVTGRFKNLALNLEAEYLDNPRNTRSQAHHQKMCYLPKTTRWPLWPEDGTTTR